MVQTRDWGTPVLALARDDEARERAKRETSGGVIFLTEEEMPSLAELIEKGQIMSAYLEEPLPLADVLSVNGDWRLQARQRLGVAAGSHDTDDVMDEDLVFTAMLGVETLDSFIVRAHALLDDVTTTEDRWTDFLSDEAKTAVGALAHNPITLEEDEPDHDLAPHREPLITVDSLGIPFTRGAFGGPRPLADFGEA
jgi:hypothetical protein